jgi:hypothetical protein
VSHLSKRPCWSIQTTLTLDGSLSVSGLIDTNCREASLSVCLFLVLELQRNESINWIALVLIVSAFNYWLLDLCVCRSVKIWSYSLMGKKTALKNSSVSKLLDWEKFHQFFWHLEENKNSWSELYSQCLFISFNAL